MDSFFHAAPTRMRAFRLSLLALRADGLIRSLRSMLSETLVDCAGDQLLGRLTTRTHAAPARASCRRR